MLNLEQSPLLLKWLDYKLLPSFLGTVYPLLVNVCNINLITLSFTLGSSVNVTKFLGSFVQMMNLQVSMDS